MCKKNSTWTKKLANWRSLRSFVQFRYDLISDMLQSWVSYFLFVYATQISGTKICMLPLLAISIFKIIALNALCVHCVMCLPHPCLHVQAFPRAETVWRRNDAQLPSARLVQSREGGKHVVTISRPRQVCADKPSPMSLIVNPKKSNSKAEWIEISYKKFSV